MILTRQPIQRGLHGLVAGLRTNPLHEGVEELAVELGMPLDSQGAAAAAGIPGTLVARRQALKARRRLDHLILMHRQQL